ncbi:competence/damage-inducible protein A [Mucilaginibacter sp.]|uniref:competence/damage-inducible protein A n=1 Tax=Mucilaginibacter sp. TaxID=1882438 RepID=UPI003B00862F
MLAEIITIGDEILIGQIIDSNSAWMAQQLNAIGVRIKQISSVSDDRGHIFSALKEASGRADLILITGGLGPTKDDITKTTLAEYFGVGMKRDQQTLDNVANIFERYNRPLLEVNIRQADVPENCEVLFNKNGTAPGMWFQVDGKVFVSMPGVPFEMMYLMEDLVIPKLKETFDLPKIIHQTILTAGEGESFLAERIADIEDQLPPEIKLAYLPKLGVVRLRLSAYGEDENQLKKALAIQTKKITKRLGDTIVATEDIPLEKAILLLMSKNKQTLSLAESCTGGYLAHLFTSLPGASSVFLGGAVSYSYEMKERMLGVNPDTLWETGAVSEETVREMAEGALRTFSSDYAVAVTGIAGPDGGTPEKPVGTVWIAVANQEKTLAKRYVFGNKRIQNIERTATRAMIDLLQLLRESK